MAALASDLCLAADVAAELGIVSDDRVQRAVSAASLAIADYCVRVFERGTVTEYPSSVGRPLLVLKRPPIVSITSITECDLTVTASEYESVGDNATAGLVLRKASRWLDTRRLDPRKISDTVQTAEGDSDRIVAIYVGGYVTPGQNALDSVTYPTVTLPLPVQEAAISTAVAFLRMKGVDPNVKSEAIGDWSVSFFDTKATDPNAVPAFARALLGPYKLGWSQ